MEYVIIDDQTWPVNTMEEIEEAQNMMREFGEESLHVWYTTASLEEMAINGDPSGYVTHKMLFAE